MTLAIPSASLFKEKGTRGQARSHTFVNKTAHFRLPFPPHPPLGGLNARGSDIEMKCD